MYWKLKKLNDIIIIISSFIIIRIPFESTFTYIFINNEKLTTLFLEINSLAVGLYIIYFTCKNQYTIVSFKLIVQQYKKICRIINKKYYDMSSSFPEVCFLLFF